jgi:hypothetical protein
MPINPRRIRPSVAHAEAKPAGNKTPPVVQVAPGTSLAGIVKVTVRSSTLDRKRHVLSEVLKITNRTKDVIPGPIVLVFPALAGGLVPEGSQGATAAGALMSHCCRAG